jgi:predicted NACHT family NTPase
MRTEAAESRGKGRRGYVLMVLLVAIGLQQTATALDPNGTPSPQAAGQGSSGGVDANAAGARPGTSPQPQQPVGPGVHGGVTGKDVTPWVISGVSATVATLSLAFVAYQYLNRRRDARIKGRSEAEGKKELERTEELQKQQSERERYEAVLRQELGTIRMLLIIGDPGSGKTTLLKYYAKCCLEDDHEKLGFSTRPLPVYLPLRDVRFDSQGLAGLAESLAQWAGRYAVTISSGSFETWLRDEPTLVLLDGLDEISDLARRQAVCQWIDRIAMGLSNARFVVTSRWTGYRKAEGIELGFEHLHAEVRDFSDEKQEEFLQKWFKAAYANERPPETETKAPD